MVKISSLLRQDRKTISIQILSSGEVVVKAPFLAPDSAIEKFIKEKEDWIKSRQSKFKENTQEFTEVINYQKVLFLGEILTVFSSGSAKKIQINERGLFVPHPCENSKLFNKIKNFLKKQADEILVSRASQIAAALKKSPNLIKCTGSRGRWGACNSSGEIFLNWRAVCLPKKLIDYIIVHELCHLSEMNHSPKFWCLVQQILPNFKTLRKDLKRYGFLLKLY